MFNPQVFHCVHFECPALGSEEDRCADEGGAAAKSSPSLPSAAPSEAGSGSPLQVQQPQPPPAAADLLPIPQNDLLPIPQNQAAVVDHGDGYGMEHMDLGGGDGPPGEDLPVAGMGVVVAVGEARANSSDGSERSVSPALTS